MLYSAIWLDGEGRTVERAGLPAGPLFADLDPWSFAWSPDGRQVLIQDEVGRLTLLGLPDAVQAEHWSLDLELSLFRVAGAGGGRIGWTGL